jgi:hypothetical protein
MMMMTAVTLLMMLMNYHFSLVWVVANWLLRLNRYLYVFVLF